MSAPFTGPFQYWVGINLTGPDATEVEDFNRFYNTVHCPEVVAVNTGFVGVHRYELVKTDPRNTDRPLYLTIYELADETAAEEYVRRQQGPPADRPTYTKRPAAWADKRVIEWRMMWRRLGESGTHSGSKTPSELVHITMTDTAQTSDGTGLTDFRYGTDGLAGAGTANVSWSRCMRYALYPSLPPQPRDTPRLCNVHEVGPAVAQATEMARVAPASSPIRKPRHPRLQGRDPAWQWTYRRMVM